MATADQDKQIVTMLYVEDDLATRESLSEILKYHYPDFRLIIADNGETGLDMFKRHRPDIVITDISMPIMDGIKMSAAIKAMSPATEIVALTAYSDTNILCQAIELGFSNYVLKPVDISQLFKIIDKLVYVIRLKQDAARQNDMVRSLNAELLQNKTALEKSVLDLEAFCYTVAHDLRSPMVCISGYAQLLLEQHAGKLDEKTRECLETINQEIFRMNSLVKVLLKFSVDTRKHPKKEKTNLSCIATEIAAGLMEQSPERQVDFRIAEGVCAFCDPDLLRIVLGNLLGNAWKYSSNRDNARIEFGMIDTEEDIVYFVRDNGAGFVQTEAENLFVPFYRLQCDSNVDGFGIGLATAARIIQRHCGRIWAEGETGQGSTFFFTL
jgi:signal transduction histidine kinase